jgi:hypothetical protein
MRIAPAHPAATVTCSGAHPDNFLAIVLRARYEAEANKVCHIDARDSFTKRKSKCKSIT